MLTPVTASLEALTTGVKPLLEKENEQTLTPEDATHLQRARAIYAIYHQFYRKIYPTAHHASVERNVRQREKKQTSHQP
jgi:hypothetical protein